MSWICPCRGRLLATLDFGVMPPTCLEGPGEKTSLNLFLCLLSGCCWQQCLLPDTGPSLREALREGLLGFRYKGELYFSGAVAGGDVRDRVMGGGRSWRDPTWIGIFSIPLFNSINLSVSLGPLPTGTVIRCWG